MLDYNVMYHVQIFTVVQCLAVGLFEIMSLIIQH